MLGTFITQAVLVMWVISTTLVVPKKFIHWLLLTLSATAYLYTFLYHGGIIMYVGMVVYLLFLHLYASPLLSVITMILVLAITSFIK